MNDTVTMTAEQKFTKGMLKLRQLRPYYSAIFESIDKLERDSIETMAVDTNTLYFNRKFVEELEFDEFLFVVLHEIGHLALMHCARRETRDPTLWNIACDLYVNAALGKEFRLRIGMSKVARDGIMLRMPEGCVSCGSLDIDKDFVEGIYENLAEQGKQNGYFSDQTPGANFRFEYSGSGGINSDLGNFTFEIEISHDMKLDVLPSHEDQSSKEQKSKKLITDAAIKCDITGNGAGSSPGGIERLSREMIKSKVDWKSLVKKYLIQIKSKDSSFSSPDKRMYYQKAIYPGQATNIDNALDGVAVCIDTSGSISDEDLANFYGQVYGLLSAYKVDANLVYWDASVQNVGSFENYKQFSKVACTGRGGTDPRCVFDYFDENRIRLKLIIMLTDGYFYSECASKKQAKKYKDTIWIMTKQYNKDFKPPFGRLAFAKFNT